MDAETQTKREAHTATHPRRVGVVRRDDVVDKARDGAGGGALALDAAPQAPPEDEVHEERTEDGHLLAEAPHDAAAHARLDEYGGPDGHVSLVAQEAVHSDGALEAQRRLGERHDEDPRHLRARGEAEQVGVRAAIRHACYGAPILSSPPIL